MTTATLLRTVSMMLALVFVASMAPAQALNSGAAPIALTATLGESLTLSLSASTVTFTLASGSTTNTGSTNITATTAWTLKSGRTAVGVYAYFASATAALTDGTNNIPSSAFFISDNGGASTALTNSVAFGAAAAGLQLANVPITAANRTSSRSDLMAYNINLSGVPQLPASTYTGTLNIQAQATP